jgi:DNA-directed RNA polymerase sigma subunit (sigma70/sigma32)
MMHPSPAIQEFARRLQGLSEEEKRVLTLRFALDGMHYRTLDDVATTLGTAPDIVRRIELGALRRLNGDDSVS